MTLSPLYGGYRSKRNCLMIDRMLYTKMLSTLFRIRYGEPTEVPEGLELGLVLVAVGFWLC